MIFTDPKALEDRNVLHAGETLITPALFSQPPPRPPGEEGVGRRYAGPARA